MKKIRLRGPNETVMAFDLLECADGDIIDLPKGNSLWIGQLVKNVKKQIPPTKKERVIKVWETNKSCEPQDIHITPSSEDRGYCSPECWRYGSTYPL